MGQRIFAHAEQHRISQQRVDESWLDE
jgi:hypothetical protein